MASVGTEGDVMAATMSSSQAASDQGSDDMRRLIARLVALTQDVDHLWRSALGSVDFDTWNRLAEASHSVHRALNCLTREPLVGISGCLSGPGEP